MPSPDPTIKKEEFPSACKMVYEMVMAPRKPLKKRKTQQLPPPGIGPRNLPFGWYEDKAMHEEEAAEQVQQKQAEVPPRPGPEEAGAPNEQAEKVPETAE